MHSTATGALDADAPPAVPAIARTGRLRFLNPNRLAELRLGVGADLTSGVEALAGAAFSSLASLMFESRTGGRAASLEQQMAQMRQGIKQQQRGLDHLLEQLAHAEKELQKLRS